jgi:3-phenylpropionate/cinnamic acid dioxygenase small subunit
MKEELQAFVLQEARLLDERRFADWLELFAEDGVYWVPTRPDQRSPQEALSLFYEPRALLAMRVARLERPEMHVQAPPSRTLHHVSGIELIGDFEVRSSLVVAEWRAGDTRWFAGRVTHSLRRDSRGLRIVLKRVDLIDSEAPHRAIAVPL